jgi:2-hydroxy-3-keto-5-methylthiopentenyl-1-phosphate phosphatase
MSQIRNNRIESKSAGPRPVIFSDFDGTITQQDVLGQMLTHFAHPAWREAEQEWSRGLIGSAECLMREMVYLDASESELHALIDTMPLDPGFERFLRWLEPRGWPFYVVSDGFDFAIRRVFERVDGNGWFRDGANIFANALRIEGRKALISFPNASLCCTHGCATCKVEVMRRLRRGRSPAILIGDGLSDRHALKEADIVFAKYKLLDHCREHGIACQPFETFDDVTRLLGEWSENGWPSFRMARR